MNKVIGVALALLMGLSATAAAQGTQTGTLSGTVKDQSGLIVPGVTVTADPLAAFAKADGVLDFTAPYATVAFAALAAQARADSQGTVAHGSTLMGFEVVQKVEPGARSSRAASSTA